MKRFGWILFLVALNLLALAPVLAEGVDIVKGG